MIVSDASLKALAFEELKVQVAQLATSQPGQEHVLGLSPHKTPPVNEFRIIEALGAAQRQGLTLGFQGLTDLNPLVDLLRVGGILGVDHLLLLRQNLQVIEITRRALEAFPHPLGSIAALKPTSYQRLYDEIAHTISIDGEILDDASPELSRIRQSWKAIRRQIEQSLQQYINKDPAELQDTFYDVRRRRFVLPIKTQYQHQVRGQIMGYSRSKATAYIEPEFLTEHADRGRQLEDQEAKEVARILKVLTSAVTQILPTLQTDWENMVRLDSLWARAKFCSSIDGSCAHEPAMAFNVPGLAHPLLLLKTKTVRNNFKHQSPGGIMVSGPNAGGKSVFLRSVGLAIISQASGIPVAAQGAFSLPAFEEVVAIAGDQQQLSAGLSSFTAQIGQIRDLLDNLQAHGRPTLIIIDEILSFTDPTEASALARAIIKKLQNFPVFLLISTHFEELLTSGESWLQNYSLDYDSDKGIPNYRLISGARSRSYAMETAARVGLASDVLETARSFLDGDRNRLIQWEEALRRSAAQNEESQRNLELRLKDLLHEKEDWQRQRITQELELSKRLKELDLEINEVIATVQRNQSPEIIKEAKVRRDRLANQISSLTPAETDPLQQSLKKLSLRFGAGAPEPTSTSRTIPTVETKLSEAPSSGQIDLRGLRLDEALSKTERALNQGALSRQRHLTLIHGHGTGTLKQEIRKMLKGHPLVKTVVLGIQGNDGSTSIELDI